MRAAPLSSGGMRTSEMRSYGTEDPVPCITGPCTMCNGLGTKPLYYTHWLPVPRDDTEASAPGTAAWYMVPVYVWYSVQ